jgi:ATP-dependent exoDNAse (exonuclease V) beta subunit
MSAERTEQQSAAVDSRERDVFLRAGAGTGKTTVLVERFCAAALDPRLPRRSRASSGSSSFPT